MIWNRQLPEVINILEIIMLCGLERVSYIFPRHPGTSVSTPYPSSLDCFLLVANHCCNRKLLSTVSPHTTIKLIKPLRGLLSAIFPYTIIKILSTVFLYTIIKLIKSPRGLVSDNFPLYYSQVNQVPKAFNRGHLIV